MTTSLISRLARVSAILLPLAAAAAAAEPADGLYSEAKADLDRGDAAKAMPLLEASMELAPKIDAPAERDYWAQITSSGDYPRAYRFFAVLAEHRPKEAEVLACYANAIGGYIGWMFQHGPGAYEFPKLDEQARAAYAKALTLDPENFTALLGQAIYDGLSRQPERCRDDFAKLDALRAKHPEYPWAHADEWKAKLLK
jgi:tetratricopeptide (TPR) repeat protein